MKFSTHLLVFLTICISVLSIDPLKDLTPKVKKCDHRKRNFKKSFTSSLSNKRKNTPSFRKEMSSQITFQNLRIHFDYKNTLDHERKLIESLIMPSVQKFFENALKVRRLPGKLRFPRLMQYCSDNHIPSYLKEEGVDADLIILVSTWKGLQKSKRELAEEEERVKEKNDLRRFFIKNNNALTVKHPAQKTQSSYKGFRKNHTGNSSSGRNNSNTNGSKSKPTSAKNNTNGSGSKTTNTSSTEESTSASNTGITKPEQSANSTTNNEEKPISSKETTFQEPPEGVVGYSTHCLQDVYTMRPVGGSMTYVADILPNQRNIEEAIWTTLHEISHILAMDYDLYTDFVDKEFNMLKLNNVIKMKSRLKDFESLLQDGKEYLGDVNKFIKFAQARNITKLHPKNTYHSVDQRKTSFLQSSESFELEPLAIFEKRHKEKERVELEKEKLEQEVKINNEESTLSLQKSPVDYFRRSNRFQNEKQARKATQDRNHTNTANNTQHHNTTINIDNIKTPIISHNVTINKTSTENPSTLYLDVLDEFVDVIFPDNIDFSVLIGAINNLLENIKIFIITPRVVETGRQHFGCEYLDGVELEHLGGMGSAFSHWSKKVLNTEFMIADSYGENYISKISLALFEDSGWYQVDYTKAQDLPWGKNKGCSFLQDQCIEQKESKGFLGKKTNIEYVTKYNEYCTNFEEVECSINHVFRGICKVEQYDFELPSNFQYFEDKHYGGLSSFGDFCTIPLEWTENGSPAGSCRNGKNYFEKYGEKICENCRCFKSSLISKKILSSKHKKKKRAACYETRCRNDANKGVQIVVILDNQEIMCPKGGGTISVDGYEGYVECPRAERVCNGSLDINTDYSSNSAYSLFQNICTGLVQVLSEIVTTIVMPFK